jgi:hypothetical protein
MEQFEPSVAPTCDDGTMPPDHIFTQWGNISIEAGERFGKTLRLNDQAKGYIEGAGFEKVTEKVTEKEFKWPIDPWSEDPQLKQIGLWNLLQNEEGIEGWSTALLTRVMWVSIPTRL